MYWFDLSVGLESCISHCEEEIEIRVGNYRFKIYIMIFHQKICDNFGDIEKKYKNFKHLQTAAFFVR